MTIDRSKTISWTNSRGIAQSVEITCYVDDMMAHVAAHLTAGSQKMSADAKLEKVSNVPGAVSKIGPLMLTPENHAKVEAAINEMCATPGYAEAVAAHQKRARLMREWDDLYNEGDRSGYNPYRASATFGNSTVGGDR